MKFQQLHKQQKSIVIGTPLGIMGCLLPWFSYGAESVNGMHGIGILVVILFILVGILTQTGDQRINIPSKLWLPVLAAGAINICILGYLIIRWESAMSGVSKEEIKIYGSVGLSFGIWMALAGAILITYGVYRYRSADNNLKDSIRSIKAM